MDPNAVTQEGKDQGEQKASFYLKADCKKQKKQKQKQTKCDNRQSSKTKPVRQSSNLKARQGTKKNQSSNQNVRNQKSKSKELIPWGHEEHEQEHEQAKTNRKTKTMV